MRTTQYLHNAYRKVKLLQREPSSERKSCRRTEMKYKSDKISARTKDGTVSTEQETKTGDTVRVTQCGTSDDTTSHIALD